MDYFEEEIDIEGLSGLVDVHQINLDAVLM